MGLGQGLGPEAVAVVSKYRPPGEHRDWGSRTAKTRVSVNPRLCSVGGNGMAKTRLSCQLQGAGPSPSRPPPVLPPAITAASLTFGAGTSVGLSIFL